MPTIKNQAKFLKKWAGISVSALIDKNNAKSAKD